MSDSKLIGLSAVLVPFSLLSFGGGPSIFAPLQRETVDQLHWLTTQEFIDLFAIARTAPGPGAMLSTLIGWHMGGWLGAVVGTLAFFGPACLLTLVIARFYDRYRGHPWHAPLEAGLGPIAVGLVLAGAVAILRLSGAAILPWVVAIGAGVVLSVRPKIHPFIILLVGAMIFVGVECSPWA